MTAGGLYGQLHENDTSAIAPRSVGDERQRAGYGFQSIGVRRSAPPVVTGTPNDPTGKFVALVLGDTEDTWKEIFAASGRTYHPPRLRLFSGAEQGGMRPRALGCGTVLLPQRSAHLSRHRVLRRSAEKIGRLCRQQRLQILGGLCDRALGGLSRAGRTRHSAARAPGAAGAVSKAQQNALQVRLGLQADCLAGIWANRAQRKHNFLDPGDVDWALQTATAIGDDRLQRETQGYVVPDAFTHGTSEQRKRWFMRGLKEGDIAACNTFAANPL